MSDVIEIVEVSNELPMKHQLGKLLVATLAAFVATKVAEKSYDSVLKQMQNRNVQVPMTEV